MAIGGSGRRDSGDLPGWEAPSPLSQPKSIQDIEGVAGGAGGAGAPPKSSAKERYERISKLFAVVGKGKEMHLQATPERLGFFDKVGRALKNPAAELEKFAQKHKLSPEAFEHHVQTIQGVEGNATIDQIPTALEQLRDQRVSQHSIVLNALSKDTIVKILGFKGTDSWIIGKILNNYSNKEIAALLPSLPKEAQPRIAGMLLHNQGDAFWKTAPANLQEAARASRLKLKAPNPQQNAKVRAAAAPIMRPVPQQAQTTVGASAGAKAVAAAAEHVFSRPLMPPKPPRKPQPPVGSQQPASPAAGGEPARRVALTGLTRPTTPVTRAMAQRTANVTEAVVKKLPPPRTPAAKADAAPATPSASTVERLKRIGAVSVMGHTPASPVTRSATGRTPPTTDQIVFGFLKALRPLSNPQFTLQQINTAARYLEQQTDVQTRDRLANALDLQTAALLYLAINAVRNMGSGSGKIKDSLAAVFTDKLHKATQNEKDAVRQALRQPELETYEEKRMEWLNKQLGS